MKSSFFVVKRNIVVQLSIILICVFCTQTVNAQSDINDIEFMEIQNQILAHIRFSYVDTISNITLLRGAIDGIIDQLDPHSSYMPPKSADSFDERLRGNFQGIGITFTMVDDKITVIEVIDGGPSERAGLKCRDKIVKINNEDVIGIDMDEVKNLLRGPADTKVNVHIERPGEKRLKKIEIVRDNVELNSISHYYMLDDITGYVALTRFTMRSNEEMKYALQNLKKQGMKQLVLDLRNNSGGLIDAARNVVEYFISNGIIVSTKSRFQSRYRELKASGNAPYGDIPLIVLINHGSASASEIVAGALQDHDRALIVGQTSFGKGLVMDPIQLGLRNEKKDFGLLMLTVARYYTPSGRLIQRPYNGTKEEYLQEGLDDYDPNADETVENGEVFYTDLGREVYGGGGITPDVTLPPTRKLNSLERQFRQTNVIFEFLDQYLLTAENIPEDFDDFLTEYSIPDQELENLKAFAVENEIEIDDTPVKQDALSKFLVTIDVPEDSVAVVEDVVRSLGVDLEETLYEKSMDFLKREIKMEMARMLWGTNERYQVWHSEDTELKEAITHFDDAEELLQRRLAIGNL